MKKTILFCAICLSLICSTALYAAPGDLIVNGSTQVTQYGYTSLVGGNNLYWNGFKSNAPSGMWGFQQSERAFFGLGGNIYSMGYSPNAMAIFNGSTTAEDIVLFNKNGGDAGVLVLKANGNVGIGVGMANPGNYTLNVNGDIYTTYQSWHGSDINLKKNLLPISDALSMVLKLGGVSYEWKEAYYKVKVTPDGPEVLKKREVPEGRYYGVIAQEVEKVLPEVVKTNADGTKAVAYTELIPVLIEAIKEQQKQIEELKKIISTK